MQGHGQEHLKILLRSSTIQKRVREMGSEISKDFKGQRVHLIGVLKGAAIFMSDLLRQIHGEVSLDFMAVSSYGHGRETSGQVKLVKDLDTSIEGLNVILVEDILDTGLTLGYLLRVLQQRKPKSLRIAALLDKPERRIKDVKADYIGFQIPNEFVVGYGLDYAERYRNLKDVCVLSLSAVLTLPVSRYPPESQEPRLSAEIARLIDHTLLKADASREQIVALCREAERFGFASVCVNPWYVPLAAELLRGSSVQVCTVVGFPLGATLAQVKIYEAEESIHRGAREIDMVINVGALKSGQYDAVEEDIRGVVEACHRREAICKVILETSLLTTVEKTRVAAICKAVGADYVKTSTGFSTAGATPEDVALLRATVGPKMGIKAAGGVRTLDDVRRMVNAGATRVGASASVKIMEQAAAEWSSH